MHTTASTLALEYEHTPAHQDAPPAEPLPFSDSHLTRLGAEGRDIQSTSLQFRNHLTQKQPETGLAAALLSKYEVMGGLPWQRESRSQTEAAAAVAAAAAAGGREEGREGEAAEGCGTKAERWKSGDKVKEKSTAKNKERKVGWERARGKEWETPKEKEAEALCKATERRQLLLLLHQRINSIQGFVPEEIKLSRESLLPAAFRGEKQLLALKSIVAMLLDHTEHPGCLNAHSAGLNQPTTQTLSPPSAASRSPQGV